MVCLLSLVVQVSLLLPSANSNNPFHGTGLASTAELGSSSQPLVALAMMIKNEAIAIQQTLEVAFFFFAYEESIQYMFAGL